MEREKQEEKEKEMEEEKKKMSEIRRKETLKIIEQDNKKELEKDMDFDDKVKEIGLLLFGWRKNSMEYPFMVMTS